MSDNRSWGPPDVPKYVKESLTEIIDYLWADERKHIREMASTDPEIHLGEHIFTHLMSVRAWLQPRFLPHQVESQAATLARYVSQEMGTVGVPEHVLTAAYEVADTPRDTLSIRLIVNYLQGEVDKAEYCRPPEEVWDALEEISKWFDAVLPLLSRSYDIYCGFDDDRPGNMASCQMITRHPSIRRLRPPAHDWNDALPANS